MTFTIAFLLGLASSGHCFAMCGGLVVALSNTKGTSQTLVFEENRSSLYRIFAKYLPKLSTILMLNFGRICTYAMFALILTGVVKLLGATLDIPGWASVLRILTGVALVLAGLQIGFKIAILAPLEKKGQCLFSKLKAPAQKLIPKNTLASYFTLGVFWGFLPCGIVYSVVLLASTSGSYSQAGLTMLGFGLGTIPMFVATGIFAGEIHAFMIRYQLKKALGCIVLSCGIWLIAAPFVMTHVMPTDEPGVSPHCHAEF